MPLVVLCGLPCSGKSTRCRELLLYLEHHHPKKAIRVVGDTDDQRLCYSTSKEEKTLRASLKSEVERHLTKEAVVIIDSLNYIKGYRYELYCTSKHLATPQCVIWCNVPPETVREWNSKRGTSPLGYPPELMSALIMRFEPPDSRNRWDSPLFTICPDDAFPADTICTALFQRKAPAPNQSTQSQPLSESSFLHELDRMTQEVVKTVLEAQRSNPASGEVSVCNSQEKVVLPGPTSLVELRRLRKQFIAYTKQHPVEESSNVTTLFVQFVNKALA